MSEIRCVLFDFDGVIADTEYSNLNYYALAMKSVGVEMTEEEKLALIGASDNDTTPGLLKRAPAPVSMDEWRQARRRAGNTYADGDLEVYPGLRELIAALRARGIQTGVVSSTNSWMILTALNRLRMLPCFDVVICGDMTEKHKPDPDPYHFAMRTLDVRPEETVIVEDSPTGIRAALASGAKVVAFTGGSIPQDVSGAHVCTDNYADLLDRFVRGAL